MSFRGGPFEHPFKLLFRFSSEDAAFYFCTQCSFLLRACAAAAIAFCSAAPRAHMRFPRMCLAKEISVLCLLRGSLPNAAFSGASAVKGGIVKFAGAVSLR